MSAREKLRSVSRRAKTPPPRALTARRCPGGARRPVPAAHRVAGGRWPRAGSSSACASPALKVRTAPRAAACRGRALGSRSIAPPTAQPPRSRSRARAVTSPASNQPPPRPARARRLGTRGGSWCGRGGAEGGGARAAVSRAVPCGAVPGRLWVAARLSRQRCAGRHGCHRSAILPRSARRGSAVWGWGL